MRPPTLSLIQSFNQTRANNNNLEGKRNIHNFWMLYKNNPNVKKLLKKQLPIQNRNNNSKIKSLFFVHHNQPWVRKELFDELNILAKKRLQKKRRTRMVPRRLELKSRRPKRSRSLIQL